VPHVEQELITLPENHSLKTNILHFSFIDCSCVVIESSFDPGERLQAPGSLWFFY
jgi:hypothetical protein